MEDFTTHTEGWVIFKRVYCRGGFIDRWHGDSIDNPNNKEANQLHLNTTATYYRLNGKGEWIARHELKDIFGLLGIFSNTSSADEIWKTAINQTKG